MRARASDQDRKLRRIVKQAAFREILAFRIAQRAMHQHAEQQRRHIDQHQADKNFAGVEARPQKSGDRGPGHAAERASQADERQHP